MIEIENKIPEMLKISMIESNNGQIEGLPKNPRLWEDYEIDNLVASIEQTPELLEARPIIVVKRSLKKYVTLGGNMRLAALKKMGVKETMCYVLKDISLEQMKEIVLKDNSSFGEWDTDELAYGWADLPLEEWGIRDVNMEDTTDYEGKNSELDTTEWEETMVMRFKLTEEELQYITSVIGDKDARVEILKRLGYGENR